MNNRESKKLLAEKHNAEYIEGKKPKVEKIKGEDADQTSKRKIKKHSKQSQMLVMLMAAQSMRMIRGL